MRRDLDLVRSILKTAADSSEPMSASAFTDDAHPFELVAYHVRIMQEASRDKDFEDFCNDGSELSIGDLLTWYANRFKTAFFHVGETLLITDKELERWLNWCLYYGKPRDEYPFANQD